MPAITFDFSIRRDGSTGSGIRCIGEARDLKRADAGNRSGYLFLEFAFGHFGQFLALR
jgi:hypothetical protein